MKHFTLLLSVLLASHFTVAQNPSKLPSVTVQTMEGKKVDTRTLSIVGKPMIIKFWANWCAHC
ncbi:MAG: TlpA family protein disulfide reductase [Flavobacteriales bacterium]